jgi:superoxide dismutase, Cu-Zn family
MKTLRFSIFFLASLFFAAAQSADVAQKRTAKIEAKSGSSASGNLSFSQKDGKVHIEGSISGLKPNHLHGFHVHEKGDCSDDKAKNAGGHFVVGNMPHGSPQDAKKHNGDLGNIMANAKGVAKIDVFSDDISLDPKDGKSIINRAVVVHADRDDLKGQPSGNAGDRVGCGVIK